MPGNPEAGGQAVESSLHQRASMSSFDIFGFLCIESVTAGRRQACIEHILSQVLRCRLSECGQDTQTSCIRDGTGELCIAHPHHTYSSSTIILCLSRYSMQHTSLNHRNLDPELTGESSVEGHSEFLLSGLNNVEVYI